MLIALYCLEDEKVSTDELQEKIAEFDDYVQSTDIAAMQSAFHSRLPLHVADTPGSEL